MKKLSRSCPWPSSFLLAFVIMFIAFCGYSVPTYYNEWLSEFSLPIEYRQSALNMSLGGIFFGGVLLLFPLCAALSCGPDAVSEFRSKMFEWRLIRSSWKRYVIKKCVYSFGLGALSVGMAYLCHSCLCHLVVLPYDPASYPGHDIGFWSESFFLAWSEAPMAWPILLEILVGMSVSAGIWAVFAVAIAAWIPDKMLVIIVPAAIYRLWNGNITYYFFGFRLPSPDTLFNDAQTVTGDLQCLLSYTIFLLLSVLLLWYGVKRRLLNEK